jgi:hypothetical protein
MTSSNSFIPVFAELDERHATRTKPLARRTPEAGVVGEEPKPALTLVTRDSARQDRLKGMLRSWRLGVLARN